MDDGTADEYEIQFTDKSIPPITKVSMGREVAIINEGDLNNDKKDDISTYTHPLNGFHDVMSTYSFMDNKWIIVIPIFGILTEGDYLNYDELQKMVFKEGNSFAYYFDIQREIINNKKFEFYFKVIGGPKGQEESGYQSILLVFSEGKKILEDTDSISPPQNLIYEFVDVNGDGYTDIKWQTVTACGKCGEFFNLYVFDPTTNLFKTTIESFGQQNIKQTLRSNPSYYYERSYGKDSDILEYNLFKIENGKNIYKGTLRFDGTMEDESGLSGQKAEIYKSGNGITKWQDGKLIGQFVVQNPPLDIDKYFNENYKKFE